VSGKKRRCQSKGKKYIKMETDMLDKLKIMKLIEQVYGRINVYS
jgi:hypothetical protein